MNSIVVANRMENYLDRSNSQLPVILSMTGSLTNIMSLTMGKDTQIMNYFERHLASIHNRYIQWEIYKNAELISERELEILKQIDRVTPSILQQLFEIQGEDIITVLFRILRDLKRDEPVELALAILIQLFGRSSNNIQKLKMAYSEYTTILFRFVPFRVESYIILY
jgi:hypothetical protein